MFVAGNYLRLRWGEPSSVNYGVDMGQTKFGHSVVVFGGNDCRRISRAFRLQKEDGVI